MIPFHALAEIFPLIEGDDFDELAKDIRERGLRERIELLDGRILDGRNRYRACVAAGLIPAELTAPNAGHLKYFHSFVPAGADTPSQDELVAYVISKNLRRRQLSDDQRRMVAARLVNLKQGRLADGKTSQSAKISRDGAAKMLASDVAGIDRARSIISHAMPEVIAAVEQGRVSVAAAAELAAQPLERQAEILKTLPRDEAGKLTSEVKKALAPVIKEIRVEKIAAKKARRTEREVEWGKKLQQIPEESCGIGLEDFEYDQEVWSTLTGTDRHPSMHYETASDAHTPEEIVARCAERFKCLAKNCILFKWSTIPHLHVAMEVLKLQGFRYVTHLVWNKERPGAARGPGYWFTGEHEIVLVGVRGKVVPPAVAQFRSSFSAPIGAHSEKPDNLHEIIEFHWPNVPKVEFNARRSRPGWRVWGFEAPSQLATNTEPRQATVPPAHAAPVVDDVIDLPNILRRGGDSVAPWMTNGAAVRGP